MTAVDQIPVDVLDDEDAQTPEWEQLLKQQGSTGAVNVIPRGTFAATLVEVMPVRRRDGGGWALRMLAVTTNLQRYVLAWRGLSEDPHDPYALSEAQVRGLRKFAASMGVPVPAPAAEIVEALRALRGQPVEAKVAHTPVGPQATLSRPDAEPGPTSSSSTSLVNGQAVDANGEVMEGAAAAAFVAHQRLLDGLGAVRAGLVQMARGCHDLSVGEGWLALGFENVSEYLASPEITLSRSQFYRLADIWQQYVVDGGLRPEVLAAADESKLEVPLPALRQGVVSAERAAADATSLTRRDLRERYRELLGGDLEPAPPTITVNESQPEDEVPAGGTDEYGESWVDGVEPKPFDADELVQWAESYGHPETWAKKAQDLHGKVDAAQAKAASAWTDLGDMTVLASRLSETLARVLREVGRPEQKRMGKELRGVVMDVLALAAEHGLDVEAE